MTCDFFRNDRCTLGLYGGNPKPMNCKNCMALGNNNQAFAEKLFSERGKTHPVAAPRLSGCCDSALNPAFDNSPLFEPDDLP